MQKRATGMATVSVGAYFQVSFSSVVRGFHVYKDVWSPVVNAKHSTQQEHGNTEDQYAVAVMNGGIVVGHVPRELSQTCWFFIARGGEISCKVTGRRQRSALMQGGMEIPCIYTLRGKKKLVDKLKIIIKNMYIEPLDD